MRMLQDNCRFQAALRGRQSTGKAALPRLGRRSHHPQHQHHLALMLSQVYPSTRCVTPVDAMHVNAMHVPLHMTVPCHFRPRNLGT